MIEIPIVVWLFGRLGWQSSLGARHAVTLAWLLQLTHPVLWLIRPEGLWGLLAAEAVVTLVEGAVIWWWAKYRVSVEPSLPVARYSLGIAFVANAASLFVGLVLQVLW